MDGSTAKKYCLDKVALLGLFALGLLAAQVIVARRTQVQLVEAPAIAHSGLKLLIPAGKGWQGEQQWQFRDNSYVLTRSFGPGAGQVIARVQVRYLLAPLQKSTDEWLEQKRAELEGAILDRGRIGLGLFEMSWGHYLDGRGVLEVFFGVSRLPYGRALSMEFREVLGDAVFGEQLFEEMVRGVGFEDNQLLRKGRQVVESVKGQVFNNLDRTEQQTEFFLVKDFRKSIVGFSGTVLKALVNDEGQGQVRGLDFYHIYDESGSRGRHSLYESDEDISVFRWLSRASKPRRRGQVEVKVEVGQDGLLNVERLAGPVTSRCIPGPAAIPEILLEFVIKELLETGSTEMMVDLILGEGEIVPTVVSEIDTAGGDEEDEQAAYVVRLDFLDEPDYYQKMYLDDSKRILRMLVHRPGGYVIERSSSEEILRHFPAWRDYFSRIDGILRQRGDEEAELPGSGNYDDTDI